MKVYVDEMPKKCWNECPFFVSDAEHSPMCYLDKNVDLYELDQEGFLISGKGIGNACPLRSITDHDHQVRADERKKVVEEIRERLKKVNLGIMTSIDLYLYIDNFLSEAEKGSSDENKS